ncbi:hypothetical protein ACFLYD_05200 [Chloroflexota bacterium]
MDPRWNQAVAEIIEDQNTPRFRFRIQGQSMVPTLHPGDEVVVERAALEVLHPGDLVLLQNGGQPLLHRLLGIRHQDGRRFLLTGGDHQRCTDPLFPEHVLIGRAVSVVREDQMLQLPAGRWRAWRHRARLALWTVGRQLRTWLPLLLLAAALAFGSSAARAAVTLVSFEAEWAENGIRVIWETASEVDNMGFYVQRSQQEAGTYERISDLIPSEGDIVGARYEWMDGDAVSGQTYYYKLEDIAASGGSDLWGPRLSRAATPTQLAEPAHTPTSTSTASPSPSPTPTATTSPSSTSSPAPTTSTTPTRTPTGQPSATPSRAATTSGPSLTPTPTPIASSTPVPTTYETPTSEPAGTATAAPSPTPAMLANATSTAVPSLTVQPSPTATRLEVVAELPASAEEVTETEPVSEEELAQAKRRLTWSLIGIGGAVLGAVLLAVLGLAAFALYRGGYLRPD